MSKRTGAATNGGAEKGPTKSAVLVLEKVLPSIESPKKGKNAINKTEPKTPTDAPGSGDHVGKKGKSINPQEGNRIPPTWQKNSGLLKNLDRGQGGSSIGRGAERSPKRNDKEKLRNGYDRPEDEIEERRRGEIVNKGGLNVSQQKGKKTVVKKQMGQKSTKRTGKQSG